MAVLLELRLPSAASVAWTWLPYGEIMGFSCLSQWRGAGFTGSQLKSGLQVPTASTPTVPKSPHGMRTKEQAVFAWIDFKVSILARLKACLMSAFHGRWGPLNYGAS